MHFQIVYPATFESGNRLISEIKRYFPNKKLMPIPRRGFNKENGLDQLYKISIPKSFPLLMMIKSRYAICINISISDHIM